MIDAETFWSLPRSTKPRKAFEEILPNLPALLPDLTIDGSFSFHVCGSGGGEWSGTVTNGLWTVVAGAADDALVRISLTRRHLREVIGGALRERGLTVMKRLGKPRQFPDLGVLPIDPARAPDVAKIPGSIAVEIHDRDVRESYRFVLSFGNGPAVYDNATTTLHVDADEIVEQALAGASMAALIKGSRVRIEGDISLPLRALQVAFGAEAVQRGRRTP